MTRLFAAPQPTRDVEHKDYESPWTPLAAIAFALGALLMALGSAHHFGKFRGGNAPT